jgi:glutaconyl-CoA/methylmalonyl-CoA decarboxylase subunit gamma
MRRYSLQVGKRDFVIDVEETAAGRYQVVVEGQSYAVTLTGDEDLNKAAIVPQPSDKSDASLQPAVTITPNPVNGQSPAPPKQAGEAMGGALRAPMPGVILEVNAKAGDHVERGQQVAILEAMKMHNVIGAPRTGTISEVFVTIGQTVAHGDTLMTIRED